MLLNALDLRCLDFIRLQWNLMNVDFVFIVKSWWMFDFDRVVFVVSFIIIFRIYTFFNSFQNVLWFFHDIYLPFSLSGATCYFSAPFRCHCRFYLKLLIAKKKKFTNQLAANAAKFTEWKKAKNSHTFFTRISMSLKSIVQVIFCTMETLKNGRKETRTLKL